MDEVDVNALFGRLCKDKISGNKGICIGITDHLFGCRDVVLQKNSKKKDILRGIPDTYSISRIEALETESEIEMEIPDYTDPEHLGEYCRDKVTGYEGICISCLNIFYTSLQYYLQARCSGKKKNDVKEGIWIDEGRLEVMYEKKGIKKEEVTTARAGGVDNGFPSMELPSIT